MISAPWEDAAVSAVMFRRVPPPYGEEAWARSVSSVLDQDSPVRELIIVPIGSAVKEAGHLSGLPELADRSCVQYLTGGYENRAVGLQAGLAAARGTHVLLIINDSDPVFLRRSALRTMLMAATRQPGVGMVYGDYEILDPAGQRSGRQLLDYHAGRLRSAFDMGRGWLISAETLARVGGIDPADGAADLYGLRLRISECSEVLQVGGRTSGALYTVATQARGPDVFDYLLTDRQIQKDYERALTEHLRRVGAYLPPGRHFAPVSYTAAEEQAFEKCIASVVIPVHRRPEFIGTAIDSVLRQTQRNIEVIVVINGGEEDPTWEEARRYVSGGDRYVADVPAVSLLGVDVNNIGMCLNAGIAAARGKYYVQLDSDDRLKPDAVARLREVFESDAAIAMVIGSYELWELDPSSGTVAPRPDLPVVTHEEWTEENGPNNLLRVDGAGAPRSAHIKVIKQVGWFGVNDLPETHNYGEDYDLVLRISEHYRIGRVRRPIYEVVRHPGGTDHRIDQATRDRNDNAKDRMRLEALRRRQELNRRRLAGEAEVTSPCPTARQISF